MFLKRNKKHCFLCQSDIKKEYIEVVYQHLNEDGSGIETSKAYLCESCSNDIEKGQNEFMENLGENAREQDIQG